MLSSKLKTCTTLTRQATGGAPPGRSCIRLAAGRREATGMTGPQLGARLSVTRQASKISKSPRWPARSRSTAYAGRQPRSTAGSSTPSFPTMIRSRRWWKSRPPGLPVRPWRVPADNALEDQSSDSRDGAQMIKDYINDHLRDGDPLAPLTMIALETAEDATILGPDELAGLKLSAIVTQADLNAAEEANILRAMEWARRSRRRDTISRDYVLLLHKRMFGDVWAWAGSWRSRQTNIGVAPNAVPMRVEALLRDVGFWLGNKTYDIDESPSACTTRWSSSILSPTATGAIRGCWPICCSGNRQGRQ